MSYEQLIDAVQDGGGLSSRVEAQATVDAVFEALARRILPADRRAVLTLLPDALRSTLKRERHDEEETLERLVQEIARAEGIRAGFGREHLDVVGAAMAATLHPDAVSALENHLPPPIAEILRPKPTPARIERPTPLEVPASSGRHLSDGRPGGTHPISEASADRAHLDSVARSDDPHGDTKLSSAKGFTQERETESLAEGKD